MRILAAGTALPPHRYPQAELTDAFVAQPDLPPGRRRKVRGLHASLGIGHRHLALPKAAYADLAGFGAANAAFLAAGLPLAEAAIREALARAGRRADEIDTLLQVSVTGLAVPTLDARLIPRLGFRPDLKRLPVFGLGCVAGAAGLARLFDLLRGCPGERALLLSVELCSLTLQRGDTSVANCIAAGLFADGAAAVVCEALTEESAPRDRAAAPPEAPGPPPPKATPETRRPAPSVVATRSRLYPDTAGLMGWKVTDGGFGLVLSARVPEVVRGHLRADVDAFLADHGLARDRVARWVCHTGGPKVLEAVQDALEITADDLAPTWASLRAVGNLSSASVLFVLKDVLADPPPAGSYGVMLAMGPGFCLELVLLRW